MAKKHPDNNAVERLKQRIAYRLDADKDRPRGFRKTQIGLAAKLGISKPALHELLNGPSSTRGLLTHLDKIADYFNETPSTLIHRNDSALVELKQPEYRIVQHWRTFPPDVQDMLLLLFDYFAGLLPEEKEQRRWWTKLSRLSRRERENLERSLDEQLRGRHSQPSQDSDAAAPASEPKTRAATGQPD